MSVSSPKGAKAESPAQAPPPFFSKQVTSARRFYLNLKPRNRRDLTVVCGGWEQCSGDFAIDRPGFPYYSVEFVASGRGELVLGGRRHVLAAGVVFTYGPGVSQRIRSSSTERLSKYFVDFAGARAKRCLAEAGIAPGTALTIGFATEVRQAFDMLINTALTHDRFAARAARLQLESLLIWIVRGARAGLGSSLRAAATFERCRQHIDAHLQSLRTIEEAAAGCHVDVAYFTRLFRRFGDETPYRYLQRIQMQWAAERLQSSDCLVKTAAGDLGIDPFQFSRIFKRVYGIAPSAFLRSR
jgi:AraC-like DNA-binding protein